MKKDDKLHDGIKNFLKAYDNLIESTQLPVTEKRDLGGIIISFVNVYELSWQCFKRYLATKGIQALTPRDVFQEAFLAGYIVKSEVWISMIEDRNNIVHSYNETFAEQMKDRIIGHYLPEFLRVKDLFTKI